MPRLAATLALVLLLASCSGVAPLRGSPILLPDGSTVSVYRAKAKSLVGGGSLNAVYLFQTDPLREKSTLIRSDSNASTSSSLDALKSLMPK